MEAPTLERLRHSYGYDAPERSQTVNRVAYKAHSPFEAMERSGRIDYAHLQAANKLARHYMGAMGVNVGAGEGSGDPDTEFPSIYHGQMIALAWREVTRDEKEALTDLIEERVTVEEIGRRVSGARDRGRSEMAGRMIVRSGLERLAVHWGFRRRGGEP
jgi:hypothetical protein